jgi:hypothetical protein
VRRRRNLAAPAVREHIAAHHRSVLERLHGTEASGEVVPDGYLLQIMAGGPLEVWAYQLPGRLSDWGLTVHDQVRVLGDGSVEVLT